MINPDYLATLTENAQQHIAQLEQDRADLILALQIHAGFREAFGLSGEMVHSHLRGRKIAKNAMEESG